MSTIAIDEWADPDVERHYAIRSELVALQERQCELEGELYSLAEKYGIPGLDGVKCKQTVSLANELGAKGMSLSIWWALTPPDWQCPVCKRTKPKIARLDRHGRLMGQLVEHHDHLVDLLSDLFFQEYCKRRDSDADEVARKFVSRACNAFVRFEPVIICGDCNTADADAKKSVGAAKQFSFTPNELRAFSEPVPNSPVRIDRDKLSAVYAEARRRFDECIRLAREFAVVAAENSHWYQRSDRAVTPHRIRDCAQLDAVMFGFRNAGFEDALLPQSKPGKHGWKTRPPRRSRRAPTDEETRYVANVQDSNAWRMADDSWSCPVCRRNKVETMRPSGRLPWMFRNKTRRFSGEEFAKVTICGDCDQTFSNLNREARELGYLDAGDGLRLSIADLRSVISAQPHGMHRIQADVVKELLLRPDPRFEECEEE